MPHWVPISIHSVWISWDIVPIVTGSVEVRENQITKLFTYFYSQLFRYLQSNRIQTVTQSSITQSSIAQSSITQSPVINPNRTVINHTVTCHQSSITQSPVTSHQSQSHNLNRTSRPLFLLLFFSSTWPLSGLRLFFRVSMTEQLSGVVQKLAYWVSVSQGASLGDFLLAHACPIEKVTLWECNQPGKNPLKYSAVAGNRTRATGRTDSELFHWAIMTRSQELCELIFTVGAQHDLNWEPFNLEPSALAIELPRYFRIGNITELDVYFQAGLQCAHWRELGLFSLLWYQTWDIISNLWPNALSTSPSPLFLVLLFF